MAKIRVKTEPVEEEVLISDSESEIEDEPSSVKLEPGSEEENGLPEQSDDSSSQHRQRKSLKQRMKAVSHKKDSVFKNFTQETFDTLLQNSISLRNGELKQEKDTQRSLLQKKSSRPKQTEKDAVRARERPSSSTGSNGSETNDGLSDREIEAFIEKSTVNIDEAQLMLFDDTEILQYINSLPDVNPLEELNSTPKRKPTVRELLYFLCKRMLVMEKQLKFLTGIKEKNTETVVVEPQLKFTLPCKNWKHVFIADKILRSDKAQFDLLVKTLASISASLTSCILHVKLVNKVLCYVMTDDAAMHFCLTGSEHKYEFKSTMLHQAVVVAVQRNKQCENVEVELISKAVSKWLSQAKRRILNRSEETNPDTITEKKSKKKMPKKWEDMVTSQSESE